MHERLTIHYIYVEIFRDSASSLVVAKEYLNRIVETFIMIYISDVQNQLYAVIAKDYLNAIIKTFIMSYILDAQYQLFNLRLTIDFKFR